MAEDAWGIFGIVSAFSIAVVALYFAFNQANWTGIGGAAATLFFAITNFIPFGLITFGIIADLIGQEIRYSISSAIGFFSIILNFILAKFLGWSVDSNSSSEASGVMGWCMIPGLENLESKMLPMNIVSSSAIMAYYLGFAASVRSPQQNISIGVAFPLLFGIQLTTFFGGGCDKYYMGGIGSKIGAFVFGTILGLISFGVVKGSFPSSAPFIKGATTTESFLVGDGYTLPKTITVSNSNGTTTSTTEQKCAQDNSDESTEFVAEAYKNGVLVTEQISK